MKVKNPQNKTFPTKKTWGGGISVNMASHGEEGSKDIGIRQNTLRRWLQAAWLLNVTPIFFLYLCPFMSFVNLIYSFHVVNSIAYHTKRLAVINPENLVIIDKRSRGVLK